MILVPYFWSTINTNWRSFNIFLCSGGRELWMIDDKDTDKDIMKMLKENDFPVLKLFRESGVVYAQIDHNKLSMDNFYKWDEVDPKVSNDDVWRTFMIPVELWTCPVFKDTFWKNTGLSAPLCSFLSMP